MKPMGTWLTWSIVLAGALLGAAGAAFVLMYIWGGIVVRIGESDQSLAFWYLPILFIGVGAGAAGLLLVRYGLRRLRRDAGD